MFYGFKKAGGIFIYAYVASMFNTLDVILPGFFFQFVKQAGIFMAVYCNVISHASQFKGAGIPYAT